MAFLRGGIKVPKDCYLDITERGCLLKHLRQQGGLHPKVRSTTPSLTIDREVVDTARWRAILDENVAPAGRKLAGSHAPRHVEKAPRSPACNEEAAHRAAPRAASGRNHNGIPAMPLHKPSDRSHAMRQHPGLDDDRNVVRRVDEPGEQRLH
ncbi:MAG: hypothetical protein GY772_14275 [bacterium]|nr:hypothetical protein [bacterium]